MEGLREYASKQKTADRGSEARLGHVLGVQHAHERFDLAKDDSVDENGGTKRNPAGTDPERDSNGAGAQRWEDFNESSDDCSFDLGACRIW